MKKIAVIGSINMDLMCQTERYPQKGETISGGDIRYFPGGKGANQAISAARLGADVTMFGCVGNDVFGDKLIDNLRENSVNIDNIRKMQTSSGIAMITVAENDNAIVVSSGANKFVNVEYLKEIWSEVLRSDIIVLQNEIPKEAVLTAIDMAYQAGKTVIYNPAPVIQIDKNIMEKVNYITPNEHELFSLFECAHDLKALLKSQNGKIVVTLGANGVAAWENNKMLKICGRLAKVVDTTGAGDTFNGAFAYALAAEYPLKKAISFANVAASLSTEVFGAQCGMPQLDIVLSELSKSTH